MDKFLLYHTSLSLPYNGRNSFLFVNVAKIYQHKEKGYNKKVVNQMSVQLIVRKKKLEYMEKCKNGVMKF